MTSAIETIGLTKMFGATRGIEGLDLRVEPGEIFGFLGPNGAGKTTTIRALLDLQRPTAGTALVLGLDAHRDSARRPRSSRLPPGRPGPLLSDDRRRPLRLVCPGARPRRTPDPLSALAERFDLPLDRRVKELSKGNRQKVGIVLAFMHEPEAARSSTSRPRGSTPS